MHITESSLRVSTYLKVESLDQSVSFEYEPVIKLGTGDKIELRFTKNLIKNFKCDLEESRC